MAHSVMSDFALNHVISKIGGVRDAVHDEGKKIGHKAEARLAQHHDTGAAHIDVDRHLVDTLVSLVDNAALSIEFGHIHNVSGKPVAGLYVLTGASGMLD